MVSAIRRSISKIVLLFRALVHTDWDVNHSTELEVSPSTIGTGQNFTVSVSVHNTGSRDGQEVVQVDLMKFKPKDNSNFTDLHNTGVPYRLGIVSSNTKSNPGWFPES